MLTDLEGIANGWRGLAMIVAVLLYAAFLVSTLWFRGPVFNGRGLYLLRSFFPNWRFYHRVTHRAVLCTRHRNRAGEWSHWQPGWPRARRRLVTLFHNPAGNLALVEQSLIEHLSADLQEARDAAAVARLPTYRLVSRLARERVATRCLEEPPVAWQFQLCLVPPYDDGLAGTEVLTSPEYTW